MLRSVAPENKFFGERLGSSHYGRTAPASEALFPAEAPVGISRACWKRFPGDLSEHHDVVFALHRMLNLVFALGQYHVANLNRFLEGDFLHVGYAKLVALGPWREPTDQARSTQKQLLLSIA